LSLTGSTEGIISVIIEVLRVLEFKRRICGD
jgi:hypothetical protein